MKVRYLTITLIVLAALTGCSQKANESGTAVLTSVDKDSMTVSVSIVNEPSGETQYVFFQYGTCDHLFPSALYPLNNLVGGKSETPYGLDLSEVATDGPGGGGGKGPGGGGGKGPGDGGGNSPGNGGRGPGAKPSPTQGPTVLRQPITIELKAVESPGPDDSGTFVAPIGRSSMDDTSFAMTIWRYTEAGRTKLACGDHPIEQ